ncbi:Alpha-L-rhamnosidase [Streptomyces sp. CBMAI 2042]|nr:Alpha-L-rhamnosidase [Streptomyces sp. CBMAI 2042]
MEDGCAVFAAFAVGPGDHRFTV